MTEEEDFLERHVDAIAEAIKPVPPRSSGNIDDIVAILDSMTD